MKSENLGQKINVKRKLMSNKLLLYVNRCREGFVKKIK